MADNNFGRATGGKVAALCGVLEGLGFAVNTQLGGGG
jgi:hypothetical protein